MKDQEKAKEQLIHEVTQLRQRIAELEKPEANRDMAESGLGDAEQDFRQFFDNAPVYCYMISPEGVVLNVNRAALTALGYKKEELIGRPLNIIYAPESLSKMKQLFEKWKKMGGLKNEEMVIITKKGERRTILLSADSVKDNNGKFLYSISVQQDITDLKQLEKEKEGLLKAIETSMEAINIAEADGRIIYTNNAMDKLFGYEKGELLGKHLATLKAGPDPKVVTKGIMDAIDKEGVWQGEIRNKMKNGTEFLSHAMISGVKDKEGKVLDFVSTRHEVTDRRRVEEKLWASEERFRTVSMSAQDAITMIDHEGNVSFWNKGAERIFGYSEEEVIGKEMHIILAPKKYHEAYSKGFSEFKGTGQGPAVGKTLELAALRKSGEEFPIELSVSAVRVKDKWNAVGVVRDISERKRLEKELSASRLGFISIVEKNQDGILVVEENGLISYANPAACVLFRRKAESLKGSLFGRALVSDQIAEIEIFRSNGEPGIAEMRVVESEWEHRPAYLVMLTDITEKRRGKERLHEYTAELERSNEEIKQFAYIVSHDLRAPLVNLKGFASELQSACQVLDETMREVLSSLNDAQKREATKALKEDIPEAVSFINSSVKRMDGYVNAILKLARLGRRELNMGEVDMKGIVGETLRTLAHQIEERNVTVSTDSLPGIIADRTSMQQVMGNLLTNALLYLDPERPGEIGITGDGNRDEAIFRVRDNGRGISKEDMHKVFVPFKRAGKEDVPGEGMGLSYVQTLVRRHGGRIWVESELGKGTTFSFTIPKKQKPLKE